MKQLNRLALILACGTGFALAQAGVGQPPQTTPPTFPSQQQQPDTQQKPDASAPASQAGTDVQGNIQKALQQDPSLANANINVSMTSDNKVELTGTVASKDQKKSAKQIAESNAAGYKVVDHLKVEHSGGSDKSTPTSTPPSVPPKP